MPATGNKSDNEQTDDSNQFMSPNKCPFRSDDWKQIQPAKMCTNRIKKEIQTMYTEKVLGVFVQHDDENLLLLRAMLVGNFDTPYEGGFFHFLVRAGPNYPIEAPRVCSMTSYRFGERVRFNPNLYDDGTVCLSILGTWEGPSWNPICSMGSLLQTIQSTIFVDQALCNEPGYAQYRDHGTMKVKVYDMYVRHETIRVAVLHSIENGSSLDIPSNFLRIMEELFLEYFDLYITACDDNMHYDGTRFEVPLIRGKFIPNFAQLKKRLIELQERLGKGGKVRIAPAEASPKQNGSEHQNDSSLSSDDVQSNSEATTSSS